MDSSPTPRLENLMEHAAFVRAVARAAIRGDDEVDDVVQETWLAALLSGPRSHAPMRPWLGAVARRQAANLRRRRARERRRDGRAAKSERADSTLDLVERADTGRRLVRAVLRLDEPYRSAILLRYYEGLAPRDIARRTGVPVETARTRVKRGIALLRGRLDGSYAGDRRAWALALLPLARPALGTGAAAAIAPVGNVLSLGGFAVHKIVWAAVVVAVLAVAILDPLGLWTTEPGAPESSTRGGPAADREVMDPQLKGRAAPPNEREQRPELMVGPDVHLDSVDRKRDLHGIVVLRNGDPVVGAGVRAEETPWRSLMINDFQNQESFELGSTTTGPRGTFVLRLREGVRGNLYVTAPGYAARRMWSVAAGERVRVVLDRAVSLVVRVTAPDGTAAPDVSIRVTGAGAGVGPRAPARAMTDEHGVARLNGLDPEGSLMVGAMPQHEGWGCSQSVKVRLPATGVYDHEIRLPTGRTIRGVVTDATTGKPVPGALVGMGWHMDPSVRADQGGTYVLQGWTGEGGDDITARAPGYVRGRKRVDRNEDVLDLALRAGVKLRGRVVDESNAPIERAQVAVVGSVHEGRVQRLSLANGWTDSEGCFALGGLAADMPLSISVRADGHARRIVDVDAVSDGEPDVGDIVLTAPLTLSGVVLRGDGTPAARVPVRITGANADRAERRAEKKPPQTYYGTRQDVTTDDLGRFVISGLCQGRFVLWCRARAPLVEMAVRLDGRVPRTDVTLQLPRTRTLRVQVLDPKGKPVQRATVNATHEGRRLPARVDAQGWALLEIPEDASVIWVQPFDITSYEDAGKIPVPETSGELVVRLRHAPLIRGVVLKPDGSPIPRALVWGFGEEKRRYIAECDDDGRFAMKCSDEVVDLVFHGRVYQDGRQVTIPFVGEKPGVRPGSGDVRIQTVSLAGSETLSIRVLGPRGPLEGLAVYFHPGMDPTNLSRTDAEGRVLFKGLAPTERTVTVFGQSADGELWKEKKVKGTPGGGEITVTMGRPSIAHGRVVDPEGKRVQGAMVTVYGGEGDGRILGGGMTQEDGTFVLPVPKATRLRFTASKMIGRTLSEAELVFAEIPTGTIELRLAPKKP